MSKKPNIKAMQAARQKSLAMHYERAKLLAKELFDEHKNEPLLIAGATIYAVAGDKTENNLVRVSSTDPAVLKLFRDFLERYHPAAFSKLRVSVLLYPDLKFFPTLEYWRTSLNLPPERFYKPTMIKGSHKAKRLQYGVATLIISSKSFKTTLLSLAELVIKA
jgi:hypothetical protein